MKLIYIAGPFRGATPWDVHCNVHEAEKFALEVAKLGGFPVVPHKNTEHFDKLLTDKFWLDGTLELMKRCDALITLPTWKRSDGATSEVFVMMKNVGKPVFHDLIQLERWLLSQKTIEGFFHPNETSTPALEKG